VPNIYFIVLFYCATLC